MSGHTAPSRNTPTAKRSPSILVTDVRNAPNGGRSAPFVKLKNVSVDSVLSNTPEVPSAQQRRAAPRGNPTHAIQRPVPRLTQNIPARSSKNSQRLVLIPQDGDPASAEAPTHPEPHHITDGEQLSREKRSGRFPRVTSYFLAEGFRLKAVAEYLKAQHHARTRLYDEALFVDYLLPLRPGNGTVSRVQSSLGDERTMERMIDISEQGDHHYEYFSGLENSGGQNPRPDEEFDPSEPQDFSPRNNEPSVPHTRPEEDSKPKPHPGEKFAKHLQHAEMFVFSYGVVVFWNFTEAQEKAIVADLTIGFRSLTVRPHSDQDIETEEFNFRYTADEPSRPRIFNDMITLTSPNHMIKLALSHAIAQSTKLSRFEDRMQANMRDVKYVPKTLALTGQLGLKREQVLQISGKLFKLRVDVNLNSNILDTPDIFWESEPSLHPLYASMRQYLEIDQRILVLNERCKVFLDLTEILADSIAEFNMDRITVVVIVLIVLSICVSLAEIAIRFLLLKRLRH